MRLLPLSLVIVACVFNLVVLRSEITPANNLNDSAFHMEMVRWADHQIGEGQVPLDGWFANLGLGSSFFHHYQSLPYTLTAYAARITGLGVQTTYLWFQYLMLALWPISVYLGARLAQLGAMAGRGRGAALPAHHQRDRLRLRARELHVAGPRRVHPTLRDVAPTDRVGAHVARGLEGREVVRARPRSCSRSRWRRT